MGKCDNIRLLGLSQEPLTLDNGVVKGRPAQYLNELSKRFQLIGVESIQIPKVQRVFSLLKNGHLNPDHWRIESTLSIDAFHTRSRMAEEQLQKWTGEYDLIMQIYTLLSPGINFQNRKYILYTDNTYSMSLHYWPEWLPNVSDKEHQKWIDIETEVYKNAKYLFVWSDFTRRSMIEDYGMPEEKIVVTHLGANFYDETYTPAAYDSKVALFVGNDFERKGGYVLLDAWEKVIKAIPDARLRIVGAKEYQSLKHYSRGLPKGVEWIGRVSDRSYLRRLFKESCIFVMPSLFEPYGMVYKEAMGVGLACIGPSDCAFPEFITDGESGLFTEPNNADDLAEKLIQVLNNPEYCAQMGEASYKVVTNDYQWSTLIDNLQDYIVRAASE